MQISNKSVRAVFMAQEAFFCICIFMCFKSIALMAWLGEPFEVYTLCYSAPI